MKRCFAGLMAGLLVMGALPAAAETAKAPDSKAADNQTADWRLIRATPMEKGARSAMGLDVSSIRRDGATAEAALMVVMDPPDTRRGTPVLGVILITSYDCEKNLQRPNYMRVLLEAGPFGGQPLLNIPWEAGAPGSPLEASVGMVCGKAPPPAGPGTADPVAARKAWLPGS